MLVTSDGVRNILNQLQNEKDQRIRDLTKLSTFVAAVTENIERVRPDFDLNHTIDEIEKIDKKAMTIRHERNIFNTTSIVKGTGLTVDAVLVRIAELTDLSKRLLTLVNNRNKERVMLPSTKEIEYKYLNYSMEEAKDLYKEVEAERKELQNRLDLHNATVVFEITV